MSTFAAHAVAFQNVPELSLAAVILAENADGSGARLEVQRNLAPDETDRMLGLATYSLTWGTANHYGGVENWSVADGTVNLVLNEAAAKALGTELAFRITVSAENEGMVQRGLTRVIDEA